jgi:fibronectin-binding autotransporter adhesin
MRGLFRSLCAGTAVVAITAGMTAKAQTFNVTSGTTTPVTTAISGGNNTVTVTGGGTLDLTNVNNSYGGGTVVIDGSSVEVGVDNLGSGIHAVTLGNSATSGTLDLTNTVTVSTGRGIVVGAGGGTIEANGTSLWTFTGVISGTGLLTFDGTGTIALTGAVASTPGTNTNSGGIAIAGGTLQVVADSELGAPAGGVTLGSSTTAGTLSFTNNQVFTSARNFTVEGGGGALDTSTGGIGPGSDVTLTGVLSGAGPLTIGGNQLLTLDGINTYTGTITLDHGTLQIGDAKTTTALLPGDVTVSGGTLSGHGTIGGTVTNTGGTVAPGGGGIGPLTVGGFHQSAGTLAIELSPTGVSELIVTGAATLGGTLHLEFTSGAFKAGTYDLLSASSITGSFATVTGNIGVGFSESLSVGANIIDLTLTKLTVLPENPTLYPAVTSVVVEDEQQVNSLLVSRLSQARAEALADGLRIARYSDHVDGSAPGNSAYGAWAHGFGGFGSTSGSGTTPGFDAKGGGAIAGFDEALNSGSGAAGFAVADTYSSVNEKNTGASATINVPQVGVYAGYWFGRLAIDGALAFGLPSIDGTRPGSGGTARSTFNGTAVSTALQASLPYKRGPLVIVPAIGMDYTFSSEQAFNESGSTLDINGHSTSVNSLQPFVSAAFLTRFEMTNGMAIEPGLRASYSYEALSTSRSLTFQPPSDSSVFVAQGIAPSRNTFGVSGSLNLEVSRALEFGAGAGWNHNGSSNATTFDATMRYRF